MSGGDWFELIIIGLLVVAVALFGAAEVSITRVNRVRAYRFAEEKRRGSASLVKIAENPAPYLNVVLLLVLLSTIGGTTIATSLAVRVFGGSGEIIATFGLTLLLFVFAEVTPKTFAIQQTDRVALALAPLIAWLGRLVGPVANGLVKMANVVMPGKGLPQGPFITENEIRALAEVASDEDEIEEGEKELIHSIFEFGDTIVREVMVPRPDITAIESDKTLRDVQAIVLQFGYSRIPVYENDLDDVIGIVYAKDVLKALHQGKNDIPLRDVVRETHFVPEQKRVAEMLREMQLQKFHIALVTDEYGSVAGLVTLEDLLEELVGEITDEYDREEPEVVEVAEGVFRVDGKVAIDEVNELLDVELPDEEWDTVGGLMLGLLGSIPDEGEEVVYQNLSFKAEKIQGGGSRRCSSRGSTSGRPSRPRAPPNDRRERRGTRGAHLRSHGRARAGVRPLQRVPGRGGAARRWPRVHRRERRDRVVPDLGVRRAQRRRGDGHRGERTIDAVAVVTGADEPTPPCGGCRQALWEFGRDAVVVCATTAGARTTSTMRELFPGAFGPESFRPA